MTRMTSAAGAEAAEASAAQPPFRPAHSALDLTAGGAEAEIWLGQKCYTLRVTRQGKLILTK